MDLGLGLSIGRGEASRKRADARAGGENSRRDGRRPGMEEKYDNPSSLRLELQLSWPINHPAAGSPHQGGFTPSWAGVGRRTTAAAAPPHGAAPGPTARGGGVAVVGEPPQAAGREVREINYSDGGPSSSTTTRSTAPACRRCSDEEGGGSGGGGVVTAPRKKLRLTKEQSFYLEESFKEHATLNPEQKLAIAKRLTLRPRQVEVWFQNRRARTKLKQTEVEYDYMKRCCQSLAEENRRLRREIQELRALKTTPACSPHHLRLQLPAATTLSMCPSCERIAADGRKVVTRSSSSGFFPLKLREGCSKMASPVS